MSKLSRTINNVNNSVSYLTIINNIIIVFNRFRNVCGKKLTSIMKMKKLHKKLLLKVSTNFIKKKLLRITLRN